MKNTIQLFAFLCLTGLVACNRPPATAPAASEAPQTEGNGKTSSQKTYPPVQFERGAIRHAALEFDTMPRQKVQDSKVSGADQAKARKEATASLTGNDLSFIQRIANDGQSVEQAALYVASKTTNSEIRSYAALMGKEHGQANQQLRELAARRHIETPADPVGLLHKKLDRLRQLSGPKMDQAFLMNFGVQAHMDLIALFEVQAVQSSDPDLKAFAAKQLPRLRKHYEQGKALQDENAQAGSDRISM